MGGKAKKPTRIRPKRWLLIVGVLLVALSLLFLGLRLHRWREEQEKAKLLTLVDREHPVEDDYNVEFTLLGDGQMVDSRCVDDLEAMLADCRRAGGKPQISASFRTWGAQERVYDEALQALIESGRTQAQAEAELSRRVDLPGYSEHQLGLAVDLLEEGCELPAQEQGETFTLRWLRDNAWRYGFILRYPADKADITGMDERPGHFRYVGRDAAAQIRDLGLSLEEYIELFYSE